MWESKFSWQGSGIWSSLFVSGVKWLAGRNNLRDHLKDQLGERVATGRMCNVSQGGEVQWIPDTGFHSLKRPIPSPMDATHSAVAFLWLLNDIKWLTSDFFCGVFENLQNGRQFQKHLLRLSQIADLINLNICSSSRGGILVRVEGAIHASYVREHCSDFLCGEFVVSVCSCSGGVEVIVCS